jgi:D-3-phosphoglycerate dehydrogenase / 2-oxoglutarate reductase
MNRYKVLISAPYLQNEIQRFIPELESQGIDVDIYPVEERVEEHQLLPLIHQYHGILCGDDRITSKVIDAAVNLKTIVKWGTGIDSINKEYAESRNIPVFNTPNAFTEPVSDSVIASILYFCRGYHISDRLMKKGHWQKSPAKALHEVTVGIVGFGNIGQACAEKLHAFNTNILANDIRTISPKEWSHEYVEFCSLENLIHRSDYISLNCDLNDTSRHILSLSEFKKMKESAVVINTARGPLINEPALIEALTETWISGAAIDVFEEEPLAVESPLRKMNNVLLSAHNVNASPFHWEKVHRNSLDCLYKGLGIK